MNMSYGIVTCMTNIMVNKSILLVHCNDIEYEVSIIYG